MTPNGCTGWIEGNWRQCCDIHDLAYAAQLPKVLADINLQDCVAAHGHPIMGLVMWAGVTLFGGIFYAMAWWKGRKAKKDAIDHEPE